MKTTIQKRYAIKVGTAHLTTKKFVVVKLNIIPGASRSEPEVTTLDVVQTWSAKDSAQAIADHIRNDFKPEDGDVVVVEFPLLVRK